MSFWKREINLVGVALLIAGIFTGGVYAGLFFDSLPVQVIVTHEGNVSLAVDKPSGSVGQVFTFTGTFTLDGVGASGKTVDLYLTGFADPVNSTTTLANGRFSLQWTAITNGTFTFYARAWA